MARMALAASSRVATDAGTEIVGLGGTAADAAVVMSIVAMCTEPGVCAPGAGGFVTADLPGSSPVVVDGYMAVPGLGFEGAVATETVTMEYGGGITTAIGPGSIAVPGAFAALERVSQRFGAIPWKAALALAADMITDGFPMSQACHIYLTDSGVPIFSVDPASRAALFDGDRLKSVGETIVFEGLADSLRHIGEEGVDTLYRGDLARLIVDDLSGRGSSLTRRDLAGYEAVEREPLAVEVGDWTAVSNPPPAIGGVMMLSVVNEVAASDDPLDPAVWATALARCLDNRRAFETAEGSAEAMGVLLRSAGIRSPSTITVSAVDDSGGAVAATFSSGYGSGVVPVGTGMLMNNSLGEIELVPGGVEALIPGTRMMSNMAPTTCRSGETVVAIGSPGADRITSAIALTLVRMLIAGDGLAAAIEHPRLHPVELEPLSLAAERGVSIVADALWYDEPHMFFGGVNGAALMDGELYAHADSRRVGSAVVV